jgi:hypothetical protein
MERRKSKRISVQGDLSGRMVLAADLDIRDLSTNGIRFVCCERVTPGSRVQLLIHRQGLEVRVSCTVVRSLFVDGHDGSSPAPPMYEVGATFGNIDDETRGKLERIVNALGKGS